MRESDFKKRAIPIAGYSSYKEMLEKSVKNINTTFTGEYNSSPVLKEWLIYVEWLMSNAQYATTLSELTVMQLTTLNDTGSSLLKKAKGVKYGQ